MNFKPNDTVIYCGQEYTFVGVEPVDIGYGRTEDYIRLRLIANSGRLQVMIKAECHNDLKLKQKTWVDDLMTLLESFNKHDNGNGSR